MWTHNIVGFLWCVVVNLLVADICPICSFSASNNFDAMLQFMDFWNPSTASLSNALESFELILVRRCKKTKTRKKKRQEIAFVIIGLASDNGSWEAVKKRASWKVMSHLYWIFNSLIHLGTYPCERHYGLLRKAVHWEPGKVGCIPSSASDSLFVLGQVT